MVKIIKNPDEYLYDMVVHFVKQPGKGAPRCSDPYLGKVIKIAFTAGDFQGKENQTLLHYPVDDTPAKRILAVGLGKEKSTRETIRKAGGTAAATAIKLNVGKVLLMAPTIKDMPLDEICECLIEGAILGAYQFRKYKTKEANSDDEPHEIKEIGLHAENIGQSKKGAKRGEVAAIATAHSRDMANEPGNRWTASHFAEYGKNLAKKYDLSCKIISKAEMQRLGMQGILGVNSGSSEPPKLVILEYSSGRKVPTMLLVGKGLTFDSGGLSLKPREGMEDMKYDMCGGAAVMAIMEAVGQERPKRMNIVALIPATDNLPGPAALKPGDVITIFGGKTVEVVNTDAEGRLILADALAYGIKKFKPAMIIDIATLTGAVIFGLGHHRTGLLANDDQLAEKILEAGERSGEPLWRLPLGPEYSKQLKSDIADLKNIGGRAAGTITGAAFLQEFVGKTKWAHLDIAGTAWNFTEKSYIPKGPSGVGVRTILEFIRSGG